MSRMLAALFDTERLGGFALHPEGTTIAYVADADTGRFALWTTPADGSGPATRCWLSDADVFQCVWRPDGRRVLVTADRGGTENYQLAEVDPGTGEVTWLTDDTDVRHEIGVSYGSGTMPYSPDASRLAYGTNARDRTVVDVVVRDLSTGDTRTVLVGDDRYFPVLWSPDGNRLLVLRLHQHTEQDLFCCDLSTGAVEHVTPHEGLATYGPVAWSADGRGCYVLTSQGREYAGLAFLDLTADDPAARLHWLVAPDHDVDGAAVSADENRLVWAVNVDGFTELRVRDVAAGTEHVVEGLPRGVCAAPHGYGGARLALSPGADVLVAKYSRSTAPDELCRVDLDTDRAGLTGPTAPTGPTGPTAPAGPTALRARVRPLTACGARVPADLVEPEVVRFPGGDGVTVPALLFRPPGADPTSPVPVVLSIHGGPETQEQPTWDFTGALYQYLLANDVAVLAPNIRGSTGFGLTHQRLIYRSWGDGDLRDLAGCVEYLRGLDWVDGARLGVFGGSYGGFAVLTCLSRLPDAFRVGVDLFGPSDLVTDLRTMPPTWRQRARDWIGDPDTDAEMLRRRSPLTYADAVRAPLLVIQGANDTRVAPVASDMMVARLRELGRPVEYVLLAGDGHGFGARETYARMMTRSAEFLLRHLHPAQAQGVTGAPSV